MSGSSAQCLPLALCRMTDSSRRLSDYITKKVADKLIGMCKTDKESYEKYWDDISPFIKYGCLKDTKFCDKMNDYILFKNLDDKYLTLPELLVKEEEKKEDTDAAFRCC